MGRMGRGICCSRRVKQMSQPDPIVPEWMPTRSRVLSEGQDAAPPLEPVRRMTSAEVWISLSAHQRESATRALTELCCQIAARVAGTMTREAESREDSDESG